MKMPCKEIIRVNCAVCGKRISTNIQTVSCSCESISMHTKQEVEEVELCSKCISKM